MLNCSASLAMSTSVLEALLGQLDTCTKRHSSSVLYMLIFLLIGIVAKEKAAGGTDYGEKRRRW